MDEFIYHEGLVQPAMIAHPRPETVFVAGGGEGATLREALRHKTVKRAVLVDIDEQVTEMSRRYLPELSSGALDDDRTSVFHTDARGYLEQSADKYDIIIIDLPDPIEKGPAYRLFTQEFYRLVSERLTDNGIISIQAGSASPTELLNLGAVNKTLKTVFPIAVACAVYMPCFGGPWGFCLASKSIDPSQLSVEEVDHRLAERSITNLRLYDGVNHQGMFSLPKYVRESLAGQQRIITDDNPLYLYAT
jgi:spermidine synthase